MTQPTHPPEPPRPQTLALCCEALLEAGVPALIVLTSCFYSTLLSDYRIGKLAALHLLAGLLCGLWLARAGIQGRLALEPLACYRPFLAFVGWSLLSLTLAPNRLQGAEALLTQVWLLGLCLLAAHHFRDPAAAAAVLWTAALCGLGVALLGLLQHNGIHLIPTLYGDLAVSTLGNPNFVAHYLILIIPLILALLAQPRRPWERGLLWLALALTVAHLVVVISRAGWLALGAALLFYYWPRLAGLRRPLLQTLLAGLTALLLSAPLGLVLNSLPAGGGMSLGASLSSLAQTTLARALSGVDPQNFSVAQRLVIWGDSADLIAAHPLLGVGPGNFELVLQAHRSPERHQAWKELMGERTQVAYEAENDYLEFAAETGLPGLAAALWMLWAIWWSGWRRLRGQEEPVSHTLTRGCLAGMFATLVQSLFSFNLQDPASAVLFWLWGGLVVALGAGQVQGRGLDLASPGRRGACLAAGALLAAAGAGAGLCIAAGDYYYCEGRKLQSIGQPNRATLAYQQAIAWRGWDFRYHHSLGLARLEANRPAEAEAPLRRSLELHPNSAAVMRLLGRARWQQDKTSEEDLAWLRRAAELDPLNAQSQVWLARILALRQDHAGALAAWEQARALQPQDPEILVGLGLACGRAGQPKEALAHLEEAARLQPQDPTILGNLGAAYLLVNRLEEARGLLAWAMAADPAQLNWQRNLLVVLDRLGRTGEALQLAGPLLEANPSDEQVQRLVHRLRQRRDKENQ